MESGRGKTRINVQGDRLSNLPDDLIHNILSLVGIKFAVQTSALSSRWRYLWTSLPRVDFSCEDFKTFPKFSKFVTHVLSCRNNQTEMSSAKLSFLGRASQAFVKKILNYAFSHNVKQLTVSCLSPDTEFPLSLFSSQSLEHLTIAGLSDRYSVILTSTWELTSLTTLHLEYIKFNDEVIAKDTGIFSKCANLKKLVLRYCTMTRANGVDICHPGLSDLTLEHKPYSYIKNVINLAAPQLKNLTVRYWRGLHLISAPALVSLRFVGRQYEWLKFSSYEFSLENVDLCIHEFCSYEPDKADAHTVFDLLQQLHSVKYLTINVEMFQLLSPLMELISYQPSPFVNVEMFQEMRALKNAESALNCMAELGEMLEHEKANIETNIAHLSQVTPPMECHEPSMHAQDKMQINKRRMRDQIDSCWNDLSAQVKHGKSKTSSIVSKLCRIEELLTELPASKSPRLKNLFLGCARRPTL